LKVNTGNGKEFYTKSTKKMKRNICLKLEFYGRKVINYKLMEHRSVALRQLSLLFIVIYAHSHSANK